MIVGKLSFKVENFLFEIIGFLKKLPAFPISLTSGSFLLLMLITASAIFFGDDSFLILFNSCIISPYDVSLIHSLLSLKVTLVINVLPFNSFLNIESLYPKKHSFFVKINLYPN